MLPSNANEIAAGSTAVTPARLIAGRCGAGSMLGMPPKRLPIVSTSSPADQASSEVMVTAMRKPGHAGRATRRATMIATPSSETSSASGFSVGSACASATSLGTKAPGSLPSSVRPNSSLIWLAKMMTAMPAVNPTVTG